MTRISPPTGIAMPYAPLRVLDLFAGATGGWTLGLHRAGFVTVAACGIVPWRRVLYAENNPHVRLYDDIRSLLAGMRVALGDGRGASAASLVVEAFGDAVVPDIPEAIGRAILRVELALDVTLGRGPFAVTPMPTAGDVS